MTRVALFFDGNNFDHGRKEELDDPNVDMRLLAEWLVQRVGAEELWGAYYYTGVEPADPTTGQYDTRQMGLINFLTMLRYLPGFFVTTFPKRLQTTTCDRCGQRSTYPVEKEVDTAIVADMLRLAAVDAFDIAILMSGDADFAPGVDGVRALGKKVYVGSWGQTSLSNRLREVAFDVIDLRDGVGQFARTLRQPVRPVEPVQPVEPVRPVEPVEATAVEVLPTPQPDVPTREPEPEPAAEATEARPEQESALTPPMVRVDPPAVPRYRDVEIEETQEKRKDPEAFLIELRRAQAHHRPPGYVGRSHFLRNWRSDILSDSFLVRESILERLEDAGVVEVYDSPDGTAKAIRIVDDGTPAPPSLIGRPGM